MSDDSKQVVPTWVVYAAAGYCFIAAANLPYGFYLLLRWVVCATAIALTVEFLRMKMNGWVWGVGFLALLFNPLFRFHFDRDIWRVLDVLTGIGLLIAGRVVATKQSPDK